MSMPTSRRDFLKTAATTGASFGIGDLSFLSRLPGVSRAEALLDDKSVRFRPEIEPVARLLEETPRERLLEEVVSACRGNYMNIDKYTDQASGKPYEGVAIRLFDPATRLWSIYWADSNSGKLDPPVVGSFENKVGHFFARDTYKGQPIIVVFRWDVRNPSLPVWSQAFSTDQGKTWEWNSINVSKRVR